VTISSRLLPAPRLARLLATVFAAVLAVLVLCTAHAGAVVLKVGGATVGAQPVNEEFLLDGPIKENALNEFSEEPKAATFANAVGNPVVHESNVYAIYWDPTAHYHGDWQGLINGFLHNVSSENGAFDNVFAVNEQYTDKTNVPAHSRMSFRGAYTDTTPYPVSACSDPHPLTVYKPHETGPLACLTDQQMQEQLKVFIAEEGLPRGMNTIYYMLTPPGVTVCLDGGGESGHCSDFEGFAGESYEHSFCSYHSDINPGGLSTGDGNTVLYAVVPWTAGGFGDGQLAPEDQTEPFYCQDGSFNPTSKPIEEHVKPEERALQEPSLAGCPTTDGFCDAGLADLIINQIAVEQQNTVTNPLLNAWQDAGGKESTDECRNFFAPAGGTYTPDAETGVGNVFNHTINGHEYYLNDGFNLAALKLNYPGIPCLHGIALDPKFTTPENVTSGEVVGFDGMESNITLGAGTKFTGETPSASYATFTWDFGDGTSAVTGYAPGAQGCLAPWISPCAASVFHSYQYGGIYKVTLTATDVAGNTATVTNAITVSGPPPPAPEEASKGGGGGGGSTGSTGGTTSTSPTGTVTTPGSGSTVVTPAGGELAANPVATATIVSRSLKTAARKGLKVSYSVNEQVAGRFEVLLSRSVAKRLGISGLPASGLAAGASAQIVLAKAILITTKAGRSTVAIQFSKTVAKRLLRSHKVTFTLRMIVRNAASHSPASTTVVTAATLSH
jgi:hypothetical protein